VVRLGADIGLRCLKCNHRILITRREAESGTKSFISRAEIKDPFSSLDTLQGPSSAPEPATAPGGAAPPSDDA
jgi:hypothetical protein